MRIGKALLGCVLAALTGAASVARADDAQTGTVMISGVEFKDDGGQAIVALYRGGGGWLSLDKAFRKQIVPIKKGRVMVTFKDVPYGEYAVTVLHDENDSGKMDMRWLPFPKPLEGGGVSNNWSSTGKPDYDKAKFAFERSLMSIRVKMVY